MWDEDVLFKKEMAEIPLGVFEQHFRSKGVLFISHHSV